MTVYTEWELSVDLKLNPNIIERKDHNIFALQVDHPNADVQAKDYGKLQPGDRIPTVFLHRIASFLKFGIYNTIGDNARFKFSKANWLKQEKFNNWITLKLRQRNDGNRFMFEVILDGQIIYSVENKSPREFKNVKVEFANLWPNTAIGEYRNFKFLSQSPPAKSQDS